MIATSPKRKDIIKQINNVVVSDYKGALFVWGPRSSGKYTTIKNVLELNNKIYCEADCNDHCSTTSLFRALLSTLRNIKSEQQQQQQDDDDDDDNKYEEDDYDSGTIEKIKILKEKEIKKKRLQIFKSNNISEAFSKMITQSQYYTKKIPLSVTPSISEMIKVLFEKASTTKTISIILRHSEKLTKFEKDFFYSLFKIEEFTEFPVCLYLLSEIPKERIISIGREFKPIRNIHFTQYDPNEICLIVSKFKPDFNDDDDEEEEEQQQQQQVLSKEQKSELYIKLVELVVRIFYTTTKSIYDIIYVCHNLYPKYIEPLLNGTTKYNNNNNNNNLDSILYENINQEILKSLLNITEKDRIISDNINNNNSSSGVIEEDNNSNNNIVNYNNNNNIGDINIPYHMKILLICCFLASSFSKNKDRLLYTKETVKRQSAASDKATGPKWFHYQRAKEIGYKLFPTEKKTLFSLSIFKTLNSLRYLETINSIDASFTCKFRCTRKVHLDFIKQISKSIQFDIDSYIESATVTK